MSHSAAQFVCFFSFSCRLMPCLAVRRRSEFTTRRMAETARRAALRLHDVEATVAISSRY